jgi:hypothetical protein
MPGPITTAMCSRASFNSPAPVCYFSIESRLRAVHVNGTALVPPSVPVAARAERAAAASAVRSGSSQPRADVWAGDVAVPWREEVAGR